MQQVNGFLEKTKNPKKPPFLTPKIGQKLDPSLHPHFWPPAVSPKELRPPKNGGGDWVGPKLCRRHNLCQIGPAGAYMVHFLTKRSKSDQLAKK